MYESCRMMALCLTGRHNLPSFVRDLAPETIET